MMDKVAGTTDVWPENIEQQFRQLLQNPLWPAGKPAAASVKPRADALRSLLQSIY